jgi:hypothetical protein
MESNQYFSPDDRSPNPPCEKCGRLMGQIAAMPKLRHDGQGARIYRCVPCDHFKWIDDEAATT